MGVWGTSLFSDDVACDVRDHYRELLEDGAEDSAATQQTVEKFRTYLDEPEGIALLALAVTQSTLGRLDSDIRDRALAVIDRGADLEVWERENPKQLAKRRGTPSDLELGNRRGRGRPRRVVAQARPACSAEPVFGEDRSPALEAGECGGH